MWAGVVVILAVLKFSTSPNILGSITQRISINTTNTLKYDTSLIKYILKNLILSYCVFVPVGFEDPVWCSRMRCTNTRAAITKGSRKCSEKNRFRVGCDTEKFPHSHCVTSFPMYGIAEIILVITVAPQKDICPHGNTYPRNAAPIVANRRTTPEPHTIGVFIGEL